MTSHQHHYHALQVSRSLNDIKGVLAGYASDIGADYFVYAAMVQSPAAATNVVAITDYPGEWQERYTHKNYFDIDPTVRHCATSLQPIYWNEILYDSEGAEAMMADAADHGVASGVTIPLHSPKGLFAVLTFCSNKRDDVEFYRKLKDEYPQIYLFSIYLHDIASRLLEENLHMFSNKALTERERECLTWAAAGKSAHEIGVILGITERTAVYHLNNATKKLNATNRQQAIAQAIVTGLIRLDSDGEPIEYRYHAMGD